MFQQSFPAYGYRPSGGLQFVEGQRGAEACYVAPNTSALFMDSTSSRFFIKSADANGICSIRTYDFTEHVEEPPAPPIDTTQFITREEFQQVIESLRAPKTALI